MGVMRISLQLRRFFETGEERGWEDAAQDRLARLSSEVS